MTGSALTGPPARVASWRRRAAEVAAHVVAGLLALWFLVAGVGHVVRPSFYEAVLPEWIPLPELANLAAGAVAVVAGVLVAVPRTRLLGALATALLLTAFQVSHIDQLVGAVEIVQQEDGSYVRVDGAGDRVQLALRAGLQVVAIAAAGWLAWWQRRRVAS